MHSYSMIITVQFTDQGSLWISLDPQYLNHLHLYSLIKSPIHRILCHMMINLNFISLTFLETICSSLSVKLSPFDIRPVFLLWLA